MKTIKTLITGPDGQIGSEMIGAFPQHWEAVPLTIQALDFTDAAAVRRHLRDIQPGLIINAAGYTAVDRAETEPELARAVNATAVGILGEEARRLNAPILHFSTDYVFDGTKTTPYTPDDQPNPQSVYARSKFEGERALIASGASHLIIRTAWIYGLHGRNFLRAVLEQAAVKSELKIVNDQVGCPTPSRLVARAAAEIVVRALTGDARGGQGWSFGDRAGIYHLCCGGSTSWFDFARRIFELADVHPKPRLVPITTEAYGARAARPKYSVMDCSRTREVFGVALPDWDHGLQHVLAGHTARINAKAAR